MSRQDDDPTLQPNELPEEDAPTEEEVRQAQDLARALSRGTATPEVATDALEAAALLRVATRPELSRQRRDEIWQELDERLARTPTPSSELHPLRWLWLLVPGLGVAAMALYVGSLGGDAMERSASVALEFPSPSAELLQAQAAWATGSAEDAADLERQMVSYRDAVLASLEEGSR